MLKTELAKKSARVLVPALAALSLAACGGGETAEPELEADVEDISGGELMVEPADPDAVPVDLPETEMTNVPPAEATQPVDELPAE